MELLLLKCFAQFAFQSYAGVDGVLHLRVEEAQGVAAGFLGLIHGDVGLLQQLLYRLLVIAEQGGTDAGGAVVFVRGKLVRLVERSENFLADGFRLCRRFKGCSLRSSSITTNSSPPRRATVSPSRTQDSRRCATCCSSKSPMSWPRVSLRVLKLSRSMNSSAPSRPLRALEANACLKPVHQQPPIGQAE